jgi:2-Cys peroxiredoxin 5
MATRIAPGERIPQALLAQLIDGEVFPVNVHELLAGKRAVIVGIPGAFTPVCSRVHIPDLAASADRLRASGFQIVACVAPDNPWALAAWAERIDPLRKLSFYSDGNLSLARGLGASMTDYDRFLGETSSRYMLIAEHGLVRRLTVETLTNDLTCTRAEDALMLD